MSTQTRISQGLGLVAGLAALAAGGYYLLLAMISTRAFTNLSALLTPTPYWFGSPSRLFTTLAVIALSLGLVVPGCALLWQATNTFRGSVGIAGAATACIAMAFVSVIAFAVSFTAPVGGEPLIGSGSAGFLLTGLVHALPSFIALGLVIALRQQSFRRRRQV